MKPIRLHIRFIVNIIFAVYLARGVGVIWNGLWRWRDTLRALESILPEGRSNDCELSESEKLNTLSDFDENKQLRNRTTKFTAMAN